MNKKYLNIIDDYFQLFAYGSCMAHDSLSKTISVNAENYFIGPAVLENYRLIFNYASLNELVCCANIQPKKACYVEGALYRLPIQFLSLIDEREGVPLRRYQRKNINVVLNNGEKISAFTYIGLVTIHNEAAPSSRYRELFLQGLFDAKVSDEYRLTLQNYINRLPHRIF